MEPVRWWKSGLSDHTLGNTVAIAATALGATMIEKHLTFSRADGGPDAGFSSEPHEFKAMVVACREAAAALGTVRYGPTEAERPSLIYRRSLYARRPLYAGVEFTPEVVGVFVQSSRPALGLPPDFPLLGRRLKRDVPAGRPITEADLAD
jgi:N-acetylneuraminate synthase